MPSLRGLRDPQPQAQKGIALLQEAGNLRACQLLLSRSNLESTVRHLGVEVDHALVMPERIDL